MSYDTHPNQTPQPDTPRHTVVVTISPRGHGRIALVNLDRVSRDDFVNCCLQTTSERTNVVTFLNLNLQYRFTPTPPYPIYATIRLRITCRHVGLVDQSKLYARAYKFICKVNFTYPTRYPPYPKSTNQPNTPETPRICRVSQSHDTLPRSTAQHVQITPRVRPRPLQRDTDTIRPRRTKPMTPLYPHLNRHFVRYTPLQRHMDLYPRHIVNRCTTRNKPNFAT